MLRRVGLAVLCAVTASINILCADSSADTHYAWKGGGHSLPFTSWADACTTLQAAIASADSGDTILVRGTPDADSVFSDIVDSCGQGVSPPCEFLIKAVAYPKRGVHLIGERGADSTIIDGQNGARGLVVFDRVNQLTIEGFTIRNCVSNTSLSNNGGGVSVKGRHDGTLVFRSNVFQNNTAATGAGVAVENETLEDGLRRIP